MSPFMHASMHTMNCIGIFSRPDSSTVKGRFREGALGAEAPPCKILP